jgi:endonuclease G
LRDPKSEDDEIEIDGAIAPLEFWKLVATLDAKDKALHATAYPEPGPAHPRPSREAFAHRGPGGICPGGYRTFQVAISDLAEATGYDFSAYVKADPLFKSTEGREAIKRGEPVFLPIVEVTDVVL